MSAWLHAMAAIAPHPPQTARGVGWNNQTMGQHAHHSLGVPPSLAEGFDRSGGQHYRRTNNPNAISVPILKPLGHVTPRLKLEEPPLSSRWPRPMCINAVQSTSPMWGLCASHRILDRLEVRPPAASQTPVRRRTASPDAGGWLRTHPLGDFGNRKTVVDRATPPCPYRAKAAARPQEDGKRVFDTDQPLPKGALPAGCSFSVCKLRQLGQTADVVDMSSLRLRNEEARHHKNPTEPLQHQVIRMSVERRTATDRRMGTDRRQIESGPPTNFERRRAVEARQPELTELHLSEDELKALGFAPEKPSPKQQGS